LICFSLAASEVLYRLTGVFLKADAKVRLFSETPKLFGRKLHFTSKKVSGLDVNQVPKLSSPY